MAITISGENNNDRILASDSVIDSISGINAVGVVTATSFVGNITGNVTGNLSGNVTGNINNSTLLLQVGGTEKLRLNSDRVIIGQTLSNNQPTYNSSTTFVTTHTNNPGAWNAIAIIGGHTTGASFLKFGDKDNEDVSIIGHYNSDDSLRFYTNGNNERFRIASDGTSSFYATPVGWHEGPAVLEASNGYASIFFRSTGSTHSTSVTGTWSVGKLNGSDGFAILKNAMTGGGAVRQDAAINISNAGDTKIGFNLAVGHNTPATRLDVKQNNGVAYNGNAQSVSYNAARFFNESGHVNGGTYTGLQFNITGDSQNRVCSMGMITEASNSKASSLVFHTDDNGNRSEKLRITSAGRVGVNTTVLTQQFVSFAAAGYPVLANGTSNAIGLGGNGAIVFGTKDLASYGPGILDGSTLEFKTSGNVRLRMASNGKVGINQSSNIQTRLQVSENLADSTSLNWANSTMSLSSVIGGNSTNNRSTLYFAPYNSSNQYCPSAISCTAGANYTSTLKFFTNVAGNGTGHLESYERLRIHSDGKLSLGTSSSASAKFNISHGNELALYTSGPYNFQAKFESTDAEAAIVIEDVNSGSNYNRIGVITNDMTFITNNNERLRIESSGEIRLTSANGNNSDTPGFTFRGGSSSQKANFARIHSRMVSNWGGQLQFKVKNDNGSLSDAYQTAMIMDHNGHVTKPNNPSFRVNRTVGNNYTSTTGEILPWDVVEWDKTNVSGYGYNTSTYKYRVAVAGVYWFHCSVYTDANVDVMFDIVKNNNSGYIQRAELRQSNADDIGNNTIVHCAGLSQCAVGDYIYCYNSGTTNIELIGGGAEGYVDFSGYLIG